MAIVHLPGTMVSFKCTDALDDKGYVLKLNDDGTVSLCGSYEVPFGVAFKDTKNPITETPEANRNVPVIVSGVAYVQYEIGPGEDIVPGCLVGMKAAHSPGRVTRFVDGDTVTAWADAYDATNAETITDEIITVIREYKYVVGVALEKVDAPAEGTKTGMVKVLLLKVM